MPSGPDSLSVPLDRAPQARQLLGHLLRRKVAGQAEDQRREIVARSVVFPTLSPRDQAVPSQADRAKKIHDLWELYSDLPEDCRARLVADYTDIGDVLKGPGKIFHESRYFQNSESVKEAIERGLHHERIHDLEKAARVILDECEMSGLEGRLIPRPQEVVRLDTYRLGELWLRGEIGGTHVPVCRSRVTAKVLCRSYSQ